MGKSGMPIVSASGIGPRGQMLSRPFSYGRAARIERYAQRYPGHVASVEQDETLGLKESFETI